MSEEGYAQVMDKKENIVYLSSDSDNVLDTIDEDGVYIIGELEYTVPKTYCSAGFVARAFEKHF